MVPPYPTIVRLQHSYLRKMKFHLIVLLASAFLRLQIVHSLRSPVEPLRLDDISEFCPDFNFTTMDYDPDWVAKAGFNESTIFFYPLASKLDIYLLSQTLFEGSASPRSDYEFTESQLINSCLTSQRESTKYSNGQYKPTYMVSLCGFKNKRFVRRLKRITPEELQFGWSSAKGPGGYVRITLTDKKSFIVVDVCHDNGLRSFGVFSVQRELTSCQLDTIKAHVLSLGFVEDFFIQLNYADCWNHMDSEHGSVSGAGEKCEPECPLEEYY